MLPPPPPADASNHEAMTLLRFHYRIGFEDGRAALFDVELEADSLQLLAPLPEEPPEWTELGFHQCPHCPLDPEASPRCPAAVALAPLVETFDPFMSFHRCSLEVRGGERTVQAPDLPVQKALGALMGLVMAASGCPYTARLRPMARFHRPIQEPDETVYRTASMYLMAQYLRARSGLEPDWTLDGLSHFSSDLQVLNRHLASRIRAVATTDSSVNAVILLDLLTSFLPMALEDSFEELRPWFGPWL
jgi:hypothetical protein